MADKNAPIYVKIDDYEDLLNVFSFIKKNLGDAKVLLNKIAELKAQEDMELENWYADVSDVESKVKFIDETLFEIRK
ncbi:hypothetical protein COV93_03585 [Candidatus Woesearchaeota archaeon CG11_big_fil_rev_8_21_14_0_20_43_8]|nr:MAG: hypothetical protein COV93_03585 [Candidatus Woesearchaeota archaeon CG11_big_fil_rev_8_21_14_0_20_43_8]